MEIKAKGQLMHHFHLNYWAHMGLQFETDVDAAKVLPLLGNGWEVFPAYKNILAWKGNSEELKACKEVLGKYGADVKKIDSLAKSTDRGEPFTITVTL